VSTPDLPILLTPAELAERWRIPKSTIYHLSRTGQVPVLRLGRQYRYSLKAIEAFEASDCAEERKAA